jgi:hypothetical protein
LDATGGKITLGGRLLQGVVVDIGCNTRRNAAPNADTGMQQYKGSQRSIFRENATLSTKPVLVWELFEDHFRFQNSRFKKNEEPIENKCREEYFIALLSLFSCWARCQGWHLGIKVN